MAGYNEILPQADLNFFQKIRKKLLISNIDGSKYDKAPQYLKYDVDVVEALLKKAPKYAGRINSGLTFQAVRQNPAIFDRLLERDQADIVFEDPSYMSNMTEDRALRFIDKNGTMYIKYLSETLQKKLLAEEVPIHGTLTTFTPEKAQNIMDLFSPSVVKEYVEKTVAKADAINAKEEDKQVYEDMFYRMPLSKMSEEMQQELVSMHPRFINKVSPSAFEKVVSKNPEIIKQATDSIQRVSSLPMQMQVRLAAIDGRVASVLSEDALKYAEQNGMLQKINEMKEQHGASESKVAVEVKEEDIEEAQNTEVVMEEKAKKVPTEDDFVI